MASAALAELPDVEVPRSFALTPEMAGRAAPQAYAARSANTGFRLAGGALAAALAVVLVLDAGGLVGNGGENGGGGDEFRQAASNYDVTSGAAAPESDGSIAEPGAAATGEAAGATPGIGADGEERSSETPTPTPAATEMPGDAAAELGLNGPENDDSVTTAESNEDSDGGLSALTVTEIVLAALLGASIIGSVAATYAGRRRG
ncbi:MAG TPA: hypothetical protein VFP63_00815 [Dehalococcoidia bacterium]|nr:hypothetical protein [Dehalococcoidia bacterium]